MPYAGAVVQTASARRIPWWLFAGVLVATALIILGSLHAHGAGADALLHVTRYTARLSFLLFAIVFATGALFTLWPNTTTRWLRLHRRHLGLAFALAHFLHLGALIVYHRAIGVVPDAVTLVGGGGAYLFVALLAFTSNDTAVRRLGARTWGRLHTVGIVYIWLIFMNSYVGRVFAETPPEPRAIFIVTASLGFLGLGLRIVAWQRRRTRAQAAV